MDALAYRSPRLAALLKARPRTLIEDGKMNPRVLRRELMTVDEVRSQLRLHGIHDVADVTRACIEPNGMISVVTKDRESTDPVEPPAAL